MVRGARDRLGRMLGLLGHDAAVHPHDAAAGNHGARSHLVLPGRQRAPERVVLHRQRRDPGVVPLVHRRDYQQITVTQPGSYTVSTTTNIGCTSTSDPLVITQYTPPSPVITTGGPTTFCTGGSVGLAAPYNQSYLWSNGSTADHITVTTSGNYTVTVTTSTAAVRPRRRSRSPFCLVPRRSSRRPARPRSAPAARDADRVERRVVPLVERRDDAVDHRQRRPATTASP